MRVDDGLVRRSQARDVKPGQVVALLGEFSPGGLHMRINAHGEADGAPSFVGLAGGSLTTVPANEECVVFPLATMVAAPRG